MPGAVHARNRVDAARRPWRRGWTAPAGGAARTRSSRSSWETALDLVAGELRRHPRRARRRRRCSAAPTGGRAPAGCTTRRPSSTTSSPAPAATPGQVSNYSYGAADRLLPHVVGDAAAVTGQVATWDDIAAHTDTVLMLGGRPGEERAAGVRGHRRPHRASRAGGRRSTRGTRIVNVNPVRSDAPDHPGVDWVPIRPGQRHRAAAGADAHASTAGRPSTRTSCARCTVGDDRLRAYLRGADRRRSTRRPRWAAARHRRARRDDRGPRRPAAHGAHPRHGDLGAAAGRARRAALLGGRSRSPPTSGRSGCPAAGSGSATAASPASARTYRPFGTPAFTRAPQPVPRAGPGRAPHRHAHEPGRRATSSTAPSTATRTSGSSTGPAATRSTTTRTSTGSPEAWQRPDTVVVHEPWWTPTARMADIVLPATTTLERDDIAAGSGEP